jgi:DNA-binding NarL/FixJ family response regulator
MSRETPDRERHAPPEDWRSTYDALSVRACRESLAPRELERLGIAAYLTGHESESIEIHSRAHTQALEQGDARQAARSAFWVAFVHLGAQRLSQASGWAARGRRILDEGRHDCVERGYLMLPTALEHAVSGQLPAAQATFAAIERIGEQFVDLDLVSLARQGRGRVLLGLGRVAEGVSLFDEVMVAVTAGEVSTVISGVIYCNVISACFDLFDIKRAHDWTDALATWCDRQPGLVAFRGECPAHRAEILRLCGRWREALDEAQRAYAALAAAERPGLGSAVYAIGELHRLRGETEAAESSFQLAAAHGHSAQPGLALLRLAQGKTATARAAIDRVLAEPISVRRRPHVLLAAVEIYLADGDSAAARVAVAELTAVAAVSPSPWLRAMMLTEEGAVRMAEGHPREALAPLRDALEAWRMLNAAYDAARATVLVGRACQAIGDHDGAHAEWTQALRAFEECGAAPAIAAVETLIDAASNPSGGEQSSLTVREVEILKLVARGHTNREVAQALTISEKTVARHLANIFGKLDLASRSAATAYAFTHRLVS